MLTKSKLMEIIENNSDPYSGYNLDNIYNEIMQEVKQNDSPIQLPCPVCGGEAVRAIDILKIEKKADTLIQRSCTKHGVIEAEIKFTTISDARS